MTEKTIVKAKGKKAVAIAGAKSVMISPAQLKQQMARDEDIRAIVKDYIGKAMVAGVDYGHITIKGAKSKDTLLKPGAEKFCGLFKIRATFKKDVDTWDMLGNKPGIVVYICELVDAKGQVIGEGRGSSTANLTQDYDTNKAIKIAEKRAQIDAVLRTGGLSDFFTQDTEDMPKGEGRGSSSAPRRFSAKPTDKQRKFIMTMFNRYKITNVIETIKANGIDPDKMTGEQASQLIEALTNKTYVKAEKDDVQEVEVVNDPVQEEPAEAEVVEDTEEEEVVEPEPITVDSQFIADVDAKCNELGISAQDKMRLFKDVTGKPYAPKEDREWIAISDRLDEMAGEKVAK